MSAALSALRSRFRSEPMESVTVLYFFIASPYTSKREGGLSPSKHFFFCALRYVDRSRCEYECGAESENSPSLCVSCLLS